MDSEVASDSSIKVKIRTSSLNFEVAFDPTHTTVAQLKERLATMVQNMTANEIRLVYSGRVLKDEDKCDSYAIKEGHTIHLVKTASNRASEQAANAQAIPASSNGMATTAGPFGLGGMNPDMMEGLMNSPMMQSLMSNPELMRTMMMSNPQIRAMIEQNPEIGHIINDRNFLNQTVQMARNPELMREMMRNNDRALSNLESIPGGFNHLRRMYHNFQEPLENAGRPRDLSDEAANEQLAERLNVHRPPEGRINTEALPNPWAPPPTNTRTSNPQGPIGNPLFNLLAPNAGSSQFGPFSLLSSVQNPSNSPENPSAPTSTPALPTNPFWMNPLWARFQQQQQQQSQIGSSPQPPPSQSQLPFPLFAIHPGFSNSGAPSSFSLTTPQPTEPPETRFASQLQTLNEMGFADSAANVRALLATGGNVNSAVEYLLNTPNNP